MRAPLEPLLTKLIGWEARKVRLKVEGEDGVH